MIPEMKELGPGSEDILFFASRIPDRAKVEGYLVIPGVDGWAACSGSRTLLPLPTGFYLASNFRHRTEVAMKRDGVGFSVDLEPLFPTSRSLLRIHPDGNLPGTQGCIGITDLDVGGCCSTLQRVLSSQGTLLLRVEY